MLRKAPPIEAEFTGIDLSAFRAIEQSMIGYSWEQALTTSATFNFLAQLKETYLVSKVRAARAKHAMRRSPRKSKWLGRNLSKNAVDMKPMRKLCFPRAIGTLYDDVSGSYYEMTFELRP